VVTSSVAVAGVLLVFCFLIIPSIIGSLFSHYTRTRLAIGWVGGVAASAAGLTASFAWDLPAGAAMVIAFGLALLLACILRALVLGSAATRKRRLVAGLRVALAVVFAITAVSMLWLMIAPRADQPVLDLAEHVSGVGFQRFLQPEERQAYADALNSVRSLQGQAARLTREERQSRWQGEGLSDDAVRNLGSFQQAFSEMAKGQDFVLRQLKARARERQRWHDAPVPLAASLLGLWLLRPRRAP
jgi:zinc/manganese transport system permease protein